MTLIKCEDETKAEILYAELKNNKPKLARFVLNITRIYINELRRRFDGERCHSQKHHEKSLNDALLLIEDAAKGNLISAKLAREAAWGVNCLEVEFLPKGMKQCSEGSRVIAKVVTQTLQTLANCTGPNYYNYKIIHSIHDINRSWKEIVENMAEVMK